MPIHATLPDVQVVADAATAANTLANTANNLANTANTKAQGDVARVQMAQSDLPSQPRLRVNRSAALSLTTAWQRVDFTGTSSRNANTFPMMANGTTPYVMWDSTNKLFKFGSAEDRNYQIDVDFVVTNAALVTSLLGQLPKVQYRFVIPNGISAGVNDYFPFPEDGAYGEVGFNTAMQASQHLEIKRNIYATSAIRTNGLGIEMQLSGAPLGTITMASAVAIIYGR